VGQDDRRIEAQPLSRSGADPGVGTLRGEQLQSVANGPAGRGRNRIVHLGIKSENTSKTCATTKI